MRPPKQSLSAFGDHSINKSATKPRGPLPPSFKLSWSLSHLYSLLYQSNPLRSFMALRPRVDVALVIGFQPLPLLLLFLGLRVGRQIHVQAGNRLPGETIPCSVAFRPDGPP